MPGLGNWLASGYKPWAHFAGSNGVPIDRATSAGPEALYQATSPPAVSGTSWRGTWMCPTAAVVRLHFTDPATPNGQRRSTQSRGRHGGRGRTSSRERGAGKAWCVVLRQCSGRRWAGPGLVNVTNRPSEHRILRANANGSQADGEPEVAGQRGWCRCSGLALDRYSQGSYTRTPDSATASSR